MELKKRISLFLIISGLLIGGAGGWLIWNDLQAASSSTAVTTPSWVETEKTPPHQQSKETEETAENKKPFTASEEKKTDDKGEKIQGGKQQENREISTTQSERSESTSVKASRDHNSGTRSSQDQNVSVISITGDQGHTILPPTSVKIQTGDTVFDILHRAVQKHGIQMEYQGSGSTLYVEGINNLYEFDRGSESGWMYRVNGVFPNKSAGVYTVQNQSHIEWLYTRNLGRDIGAKVP